DLDAAHLLELVRQHAPIEQLVPILDPGDAERAARHQADDARIGCSGAPGRFDELARVRALFAVLDVAQPGHRFSPGVRSKYRCYGSREPWKTTAHPHRGRARAAISLTSTLAGALTSP